MKIGEKSRFIHYFRVAPHIWDQIENSSIDVVNVIFLFFDITNRCRLTQWLINIKTVYRISHFLHNKNVENNFKN